MYFYKNETKIIKKINFIFLLFYSITALGQPIRHNLPTIIQNVRKVTQSDTHKAVPLIVEQYKAVFTTPPSHVPTEYMADGPLLGNGDAAVVMAGPSDEMRFFIGKNDFWGRTFGKQNLSAAELADGKTKFAHTKNAGRLFIEIPALKSSSYRLEQSLSRAEVRGTFINNKLTVHSLTRVDANKNLLITELSSEGIGTDIFIKQTSKPIFAKDEDSADVMLNNPNDGGINDKNLILWANHKADYLPGSRMVAFATRIIGAKAEVYDDSLLHVRLIPGKKIIVVTAITSNLDAVDPVADVRARVLALDKTDLRNLAVNHEKWWNDFWSRSFIEIPDKEIEKHWYAALYTVADCNREGKIPAGLWGWATAERSAWCGAYTLNYNFEAPYFLVGASNHPALEKNYFKVITDFIPKSHEFAKSRGFKGIYLPTGLGPWGWYFSGDNNSIGMGSFPELADFGQRSNAVLAGVNFIDYCETTRDVKFLRETAYPYLRGVGKFWEDYLKFENGRYVIYHDAIHEEYADSIPTSQDMNPLVSLGLVKGLFKELVSMSKVLGVDTEKRAKWEDISTKISKFPTQTMNGKTVFRYTEQGRPWFPSNTLGIQHIFPAGAIGLDSDSTILAISRNTINAMDRWGDNNGSSTWYSACARVGYDPKVILTKLRHEWDTRSMQNLVLHYGGGGLENCGTFGAITEMLMQSHEGVIRLFPCWPKDQDARFGTLRAYGAFLVSADLKNGIVSNVSIISKKGDPCVVVNPWPNKKVVLIRNGKVVDTIMGERLYFKTSLNEKIELKPDHQVI